GVGLANITAPVREFHADTIHGVDLRIPAFKMLLHPRDGSILILNPQIDFTTNGIFADSFLDQIREFPASSAHDFKHQQPGDHSTVAIEEVLEIMMCRHLSTVDRILLTHQFLDKGVPRFTHQWNATIFLYQI